MSSKSHQTNSDLASSMTKAFVEIKEILAASDAETERRLLLIERLVVSLARAIASLEQGSAQQAGQGPGPGETRFDQLIRRNP